MEGDRHHPRRPKALSIAIVECRIMYEALKPCPSLWFARSLQPCAGLGCEQRGFGTGEHKQRAQHVARNKSSQQTAAVFSIIRASTASSRPDCHLARWSRPSLAKLPRKWSVRPVAVHSPSTIRSHLATSQPSPPSPSHRFRPLRISNPYPSHSSCPDVPSIPSIVRSIVRSIASYALQKGGTRALRKLTK